VGVGGVWQMATMERVIVVVEDVLLVDFFVVDGHAEMIPIPRSKRAAASLFSLRGLERCDNRSGSSSAVAKSCGLATFLLG
jgi:hypothetical protein